MAHKPSTHVHGFGQVYMLTLALAPRGLGQLKGVLGEALVI
ncbi:hypothetical protein ASAC_1495 [Acidilobus saccharovorans 345-15]|uniref:Uncharacterized protein n=1 Tax=Acidilobus saccharovorans (strain DSM 16705 / JCM 18335 / VKM B-2471 / 345-15) TaxID=666510 RepID=D9PZB3_ACIS3|nr:hypothetical protein ASAC_1495 [Acidilobus saccharovorans 345-15]